jgi:AhpD family alkylhydroperoxidase
VTINGLRRRCVEAAGDIRPAIGTFAKGVLSMSERMKNPVFVLPGTLQALQDLNKMTEEKLAHATVKLVHLRASQINGCSVCTHMHAHELKQAQESDNRIFTVAAWRDTPYFTDAERAALALTEAVTRIADRPDPVPDEIWDEAARHYDEQALAALVMQISLINVWNRLNASVRQMAGAAWA